MGSKAAAKLVDSPPRSSATDAGGLLALWIFAGYVLVMAIALVLLRTSWVTAHGNEITFDRAVFTTINSATLTGFQQSIGLREFVASGGIGALVVFVLMLAGMAFSLIAGGLAAVRIAGLPYNDRQVATAALTAIALATLAGGAALANDGRSVLDATFLAASAFANSGLFTGSLSGMQSLSTWLVLLPLAVLGGLGLPVLMELFDLTFGRTSLSRHTRVALMMAAVLYLAGMLVITVLQVPASLPVDLVAWRGALASGSLASLNSRSAGFPLEPLTTLSAAAQWALMLLMLVGASSAGTGGGLKTTTLWHLWAGVRDALAGRLVPRAFGIAAVWTTFYLGVLLVGFLALLNAVPQIAADRVLLLAVSALGNVGLSHDPVAITGPGLYALCALMLIGRITPVVVLWWVARSAPRAEVAIG